MAQKSQLEKVGVVVGSTSPVLGLIVVASKVPILETAQEPIGHSA